MILLGLGSNLGDRQANLESALRLLSDAEVRTIRVSPVYETAALMPENAPVEWDIPYYNMVCEVMTPLNPTGLLAATKSVECALGRKDIGRWGPRIIDIDILAFHDEKTDTEELSIPHPGMLSRLFVLLPLSDMAPDWTHPSKKLPVADAIDNVRAQTGDTANKLALQLNWVRP